MYTRKSLENIRSVSRTARRISHRLNGNACRQRWQLLAVDSLKSLQRASVKTSLCRERAKSYVPA